MINVASINDLPDEILLQIADYLPANDLLRFSEVCKNYLRLSQSSLLDPSRSRPTSFQLTHLRKIIKNIIEDFPLNMKMGEEHDLLNLFIDEHQKSGKIKNPAILEFDRMDRIEWSLNAPLKRKDINKHQLDFFPGLRIKQQLRSDKINIKRITQFFPGSQGTLIYELYQYEEKHLYRVEQIKCQIGEEERTWTDSNGDKGIQRLAAVANNLLKGIHRTYNCNCIVSPEGNSVEFIKEVLEEKLTSTHLEIPKKKAHCSIL